VVATVAGAPPIDAVRLGLSMTALQFGIGAVNDLVDAPADTGRKPGKPIPAGLVSAGAARAVALLAFAAGIGLAAPSGAVAVGLAGIVIAVGLAYDLRLKGTAWSWLPFAVGIPILPVYGWLGAAGTLPAAFAVLLPAAVAAGAALAMSNALADVDRDRAAGVESVATRLGDDRAWALHAVLLLLVAAAAVLSGVAVGASPGEVAVVAAAAAVPLAGAWLGRRGDAGRRERAWEIEAVGTAILAVAWLAGPAL
jgi:4-hydroxybenzoate polyprenyltransferase